MQILEAVARDYAKSPVDPIINGALSEIQVVVDFFLIVSPPFENTADGLRTLDILWQAQHGALSLIKTALGQASYSYWKKQEATYRQVCLAAATIMPDVEKAKLALADGCSLSTVETVTNRLQSGKTLWATSARLSSAKCQDF